MFKNIDKKIFFSLLVGIVIIFVGLILIYQNWATNFLVNKQSKPLSNKSVLKTIQIDLSKNKAEEIGLAKYYSLSPLNISLQSSQYNLPLKTNQISNFSYFSKKISLSGNALNFFKKNGFVVINNPFNPKEDDITLPYKTLREKKIPVFITSDSLLHLYHIQFDETLKRIEEEEFYNRIWQISKKLLSDSIKNYNSATGNLKEAAKRNVAYFSVALSLLQPKPNQVMKKCKESDWKCRRQDKTAFFTTEELNKYNFIVPDFVKSKVEKELSLIKSHRGFSKSPIFVYKEDYSQYVPRGHYTRSEKLKNYFRALMWYGRMGMLLKGGCKGCLISEKDAEIQTIEAILISSIFANDKSLMDNWNRIYLVTSFYIGLSDDLGPREYIKALNSIFKGKFNISNLTREDIEKLKAKLAEYHQPKIYGGTGNCKILPPFTSEQTNECLSVTEGFKLMGQRFIPDSYVFSNLVSPYVGMYSGKNCSKTFTCEIADRGPVRAFPRGLDAMSLLGSQRAKELLEKLSDTEYEGIDKKGNKVNYEIAFNKLKKEFDKFNEADWNKNLYWSWLFSLKSLVKNFGVGYPTFMQNKFWMDKELTTALSSWSELRHDTILYAKQSYTIKVMSARLSFFNRKKQEIIGYVEPVPEFYNRLLSLTKMTEKGLDKMGVLNKISRLRLINLEKILNRLIDLSSKELGNKKLTKNDYNFIENFGKILNSVAPNISEGSKTTIIADVHTDSNTEQVLEEGVGYVNLILVAYKIPDGRILIGAGPVMSYYEFKQPMSNRLTDEKWRNMLNEKTIKLPEWVSNFTK